MKDKNCIYNLFIIIKTIKTRIKYIDIKSPVMRPNLQPKIYKSPVVAYM
jgi:hypothetical protein